MPFSVNLQIYASPLTYTDPVSGLSAAYYPICATCQQPSGVGNITVTDPNYQIYSGVDITVNKRYSNRWQMQAALTLQTNPNYFPEGSATFINPTGREFREGISTIPAYLLKASGSYTFPWDVTASANYNFYEGATRTVTINGPGDVSGGVNASGVAQVINYATLDVQARDEFRFDNVSLLDMGLQKVFQFRGGKNRIKLMFDAFNVFNINVITAYSSNNRSLAGYTQPTTIVPPRVFRVGPAINF